METLQDFVSARFGELTAATGLTDWARHALNAVTSAASSVRATPVTTSGASPRPGHPGMGRDLRLIRPGVERC